MVKEIAHDVIRTLESHPTLIVILLFNLILLGAAGWYLVRLEDNRAKERERFTQLFERCMLPPPRP